MSKAATGTVYRSYAYSSTEQAMCRRINIHATMQVMLVRDYAHMATMAHYCI